MRDIRTEAEDVSTKRSLFSVPHIKAVKTANVTTTNNNFMFLPYV